LNPFPPHLLLDLVPRVPDDLELTRDRWAYKIVKSNRRDRFASVSPAAFQLLVRAGGGATVRELLPDPNPSEVAALLGELSALWRNRFLRLAPADAGRGV
jgi:hypothetical protein